jgi:hypothetical protein
MRALTAGVCAGCLIAGLALLMRSAPSTTKTPSELQKLLVGFRAGAPDNRAYEDLFRYFVEGFETHRSKFGALTQYRGLPSKHGARVDALEGFSRSAPLWGAWVASGRPVWIELQSGAKVNLVEEFRRGLTVGTDRSSSEYWGDIGDLDQRIVEASDIALSLWLFRKSVWGDFTDQQKHAVISWLSQALQKKTSDNNWHLFPVFVDAVMRSLGANGDRGIAAKHYARFKEFYRGGGWFSDGPGELFDYYNAWAIHYQLYWLQQVDPEWDRVFITNARRQFLTTYPYLIGPRGFPILGRSVCYRMAAPVPLLFGQDTDPEEISPGEARRALDATWTYFIQRHALLDGNITQGYCGSDPRILDNYSGPASCLWALRSLVIGFYFSGDSPLWTVPQGRLPVETRSYTIAIPAAHWVVSGDQSNGTIEIRRLASLPGRRTELAEYGPLRQLASALMWRPFRPENNAAKYDGRIYESSKPFCGCLP